MYLLKLAQRNLKVLLSIGGYTYSQEGHFDFMTDASARATFVSSAVSMVENFGLDGVDLDVAHGSHARIDGLLPGSLQRCTEGAASDGVLSKSQLDKQATEAVQPECGEARERHDAREHRASAALLHEDGDRGEEGVSIIIFYFSLLSICL